jgi:hypothetical protein
LVLHALLPQSLEVLLVGGVAVFEAVPCPLRLVDPLLQVGQLLVGVLEWDSSLLELVSQFILFFQKLVILLLQLR